MHRYIRPNPPAFAVKVITAVVAAITLSGANAAGLGKLTVLSSLGQPLRAEIELTSVSQDEAGSLMAKMASVQAFRNANVEYNPALMSVHFAIEHRGSRQVVRVTSSQPMNEPYLGFLLELTSNKGQIQREYTFLLDPAELRHSSHQAPIVSPSATSAPVAVKALPGRIAHAEPASAAEDAVPNAKGKSEKRGRRARSAASSDGKYRIKPGDTLGSIAAKHKPDQVSLDQMLVSLYRTNPDAFIGSNMNRLKSGRVMTIPDAATAGSISASDAHNFITAQSSDFNQYRNKLAGTVAKAPSQQTEQTSQGSGGKVTAKVEEQPTAVSKSADRLKLSKENAGTGSKASGTVSTEDKLSKDKSKADAQARVKELEKNIKELQGVLDMKSKDLAAQQKQAESTSANAAQAPAAGASQPAVQPPAAQAPAAQPSPEAQQQDANKPRRTPAPLPPEPNLLDDALDNAPLLGGIAVVVLGLGFFVMRKLRGKKNPDETADQYLTDSPATDAPNSLFGSTGGQSVNTNNSIFNSSFTPSASQLDANEVDPVAEADVYIAYGREAQAIEILKDALRAQPERNTVRVKLLEIYASQNDVMSFDAVASDLYALTKGEGEDWAYAAKLGLSIDPKNPLYADNELLEEAAEKPASLHALTNPVAELDPDSLMASTRLQNSGVLSGNKLRVDAEPVKPSADQLAAPDILLDFGAETDMLEPKTEMLTPQEPAVEQAAVAQQTSSDQEILEVPAQVPEDSAIDFAFEKEDIPAAPAKAAKEELPTVAASEGTMQEFENMLDFYSKKDDVAEKPEAASQPVAQKVAEPVEEQSFEVSFDMPAAEEKVAKPVESASFESIDLSSDIQVAPAKAADPDLASQPAVSAPDDAAALDFDFSSINLDLGSAQPGVNGSTPPVKEASSLAGGAMATKLDLATAYLEIGDKEGARELLEEVVKSGSSPYADKAKEALTKLS